MTHDPKLPLLVRLALRLTSRVFRDAHADEIRADLAEHLSGLGPFARWREILLVSWDLLLTAWRIRRRPLRRRGRQSDAASPAVTRGRRSRLGAWSLDLRSAARGLLRTPGHSATIVFTLGLALALAVVVFGVFHGVLLQPLPYDDPDELVMIHRAWTERGVEKAGVTAGDLRDVEREIEGLREVAGVATVRQNFVATTPGASPHARLVDVGWATDDLFALLGVEAHRGRLFVRGEAPQVAVLSHEFWRDELGADADVLGRAVELDGWSYTVVGVLPPDFDLELPNGSSGHDVWRLPDDRWANGDLWGEDVRHSASGIIRAFARLDVDSQSPEAARSAVASRLDVLSAELRERFPEYDEAGIELRVRSYHEALVAPVRPMLALLLGAVGFVLAIACANVMHLVLVRARARTAELGMRQALGASRWHVVRLLVVESLLLAGAAGGLGLLLSSAGYRLLERLRPEGLPRFESIGLDPAVLGAGLAAAFGSVLLFGLWPAWRASRADLSRWLRGWRLDSHDARLGPWLVGAEIALSMVLLAGAGLLLQSLLRLQEVDPGFHTDDVLTFSVSLPSTRYDYRAGETGTFLQALEREMVTVAGVEGVSSIWPGPLSPSTWSGDVTPPGGDTGLAEYRLASASFFDTLGIPLVAGRTFAPNDPRERVVISRSVAERIWGDPQRAVGRTLETAPWGPDAALEVIGVADDARLRDLRQAEPDVAYFDARHWSWADWEVDYVVRTSRDPKSLIPELRERLARLDAQIPLANVWPLDDLAADQRSMNRFALALVGVFAAVAAVLAAVGLYGVVAYSVSRRRRELGIRLALGSDRSGVVSLVLSRGARWIAGGLAAGLAAAALLGRTLEGLLYGVGSSDLRTLAATALLLGAVGLGACLVPALRASRVDPSAVLRAE